MFPYIIEKLLRFSFWTMFSNEEDSTSNADWLGFIHTWRYQLDMSESFKSFYWVNRSHILLQTFPSGTRTVMKQETEDTYVGFTMTSVTDVLQRSLSEYNIEHIILPENQMETQEEVVFVGFNYTKTDMLCRLFNQKIKTKYHSLMKRSIKSLLLKFFSEAKTNAAFKIWRKTVWFLAQSCH